MKNTRKAIIWLCLAHFICDVYSGFLNPIMPFIAAKLGFSMAVATVIISVSHICSSMLQPIFGFFADNMLKRFFIFWGLLLASIFVPLTPNAPTIWLLVFFMIMGSIGNSFFHPQSIGFVNYFSREKNCTENMGFFMSLGTFGFALGPLLAALITQILGLSKISHTSVWGILLAFSMFYCIPKLSNQGIVPNHKDFFKSFKEILTNRDMNYLMIVSAMKSLITNAFCILLPFLWKDMGHSPFYIGFALFLFVSAGAISSFISARIEKIFGSKAVIYFSLWATLPLMTVFWFVYKTHPVLSVVLFFLIGFSTMLAQPVVMVWAQRILPEYKSIVAGFINGFCWGVVALCISVMGGIAQFFGIMNVLFVVSIIPAICSYYVKYLKEE